MNTIMTRFRETGVVPVVVLENVKDALPTANALSAGGVGVMEITLRTDAALGSIKSIAKDAPDVLIGAGTVLTLDQCKACLDAGARFIVSPGFRPEMVRWCMDNDIPVLPGCVTPTEIMQGLEMGIRVFKFFPANVYGGLKGMQALSAPFVGIRFVPTGGANAENLKEYLSAPFIHAVGGSWLCTKQDIAAGNFERIKEFAKAASAVVKETIINNNIR